MAGYLGHVKIRNVLIIVAAGLLTFCPWITVGPTLGAPCDAKASAINSINTTHTVARSTATDLHVLGQVSTSNPKLNLLEKTEAGSSGISAMRRGKTALGLAKPSGSLTVFDIINFIIGLSSLMLSAFCAVFAYRAATRSDQLLKRLVVYPFRELDFEFSELLNVEREILMQVFSLEASGKEVKVSDIFCVQLRPVDVENALHKLVERKWLVRKDDYWGSNPDRVPYLTFAWEVKHES